jgi:hypothetical protein
VEYLHLGDLLRQPGPDPLKPLVTEVLRRTMDEQPSLVVIDSAKALQDFTDPVGAENPSKSLAWPFVSPT